MAGHSPTAGVGGGSGATDESLDVIYGLLADRRRRYALASLTDRPRSIPRRELARDIAAHETDAPVGEVSEGTLEDVTLSLVHKHLPKLSEAGVVEYERESGLVRATSAADEVRRVLTRTTATVVDSAEDRCQIDFGDD